MSGVGGRDAGYELIMESFSQAFALGHDLAHGCGHPPPGIGGISLHVPKQPAHHGQGVTCVLFRHPGHNCAKGRDSMPFDLRRVQQEGKQAQQRLFFMGESALS
ncbi:MAG: hypothetical protein BA865_12005 [Desulfobacterales bacterium S5133MH4]|nr:MAG: hypothetical protein BA865_12005 [Desulfobacterales bacterium S5133MH4]